MRTVRLGRTGLQVTEIGFGGIPIQRLSAQDAVEVIQHCLDLGINWIDTAHGYTVSQTYIGQAIRGRREGLILATKSPAHEADEFRKNMEQSFQQLGVDYIDLFQFHNVRNEEAYEKIMAPGGPFEIACRARDEGRIGHLGFTTHSLDIALELVATDKFETVMYQFNFLADEAVAELLPLCERHDVGFIAMKTLAGGFLDDANLCFKWLRQFPQVLPLPGIQRCEEIDEIMRVMAGPAELTAAEWADIERLRATLGRQFCHACDYCQPCPQGIPISGVLRMRGTARRMPEDRAWGEDGQKTIALAGTCVECGECETRCPYDLPIRELLKETCIWYDEQMALRRSAPSA